MCWWGTGAREDRLAGKPITHRSKGNVLKLKLRMRLLWAAGNVVFAEIMTMPNGMSKGCG